MGFDPPPHFSVPSAVADSGSILMRWHVFSFDRL